MSTNKPAKPKKRSQASLIVLIILALILSGTCVYTHFEHEKTKQQIGSADKRIEQQQEQQTIDAINEYNAMAQKYDEEVKRINAENVELTRRIKPQPKSSGWDMTDVSTFGIENEIKVQGTRQQLLTGGALLVNYWHPIPRDMPEDQLVSIQTTLERRWQVGIKGAAIKMYPVAVEAYDRMMTAAKEDGLQHYIASEAFRSNQDQQETWDKYVAKKEYSKYSGEALKEKVNESVSYPGTSEYQSGFAVCIQRYTAGEAEFNKTFAGTEHSTWLLENSWKYGFIFRYPISGYPTEDTIDKSWKTGRNNQLSIYRYVGAANAAVMHMNDWCMEEYYEYLVQHPHIEVYENGVLRYEIARFQYDGSASAIFSVNSACTSYEASLDNIGGIIVCMTYGE